MLLDVVKIILPTALTFFIGILITSPITDFLYKNKMWKSKAGKLDTSGNTASVFNKFHSETEAKTPRMGGIVIWLSVLIVVFLLLLLSKITSIDFFKKIDFLSRNQTWIPLTAMILGAVIGLIDDLFEIKGKSDGIAGGISSTKRLALVSIISLFVASWFYFKLGVSSISLPFQYYIDIGFLIIPFFILVTIIIYSGGVIDGLDGLSGGIFAIMFSAYGIIAFSLGQINLAAFCGAIVGGTLAFLWFNIPPARFYMTETGSMSLTIVLAIVAFMTDHIVGGIGFLVLPIIAFPLIATAGSSFIQIMSKKYRNGKKVFLAAPLHYHFEAIGWPSYKVVMRYWIISVILATIGILFALLFV
ncbi:MAG TPA: hypothetical protein PJ997_00130 [Candidatus Paceibacterota bacterium]|nr:hypothetical protein [Candidatus Paceibacterota bacterium]HMP18738.1 hypothetical protein [Candidatus Paceibacterota bacterium]